MYFLGKRYPQFGHGWIDVETARRIKPVRSLPPDYPITYLGQYEFPTINQKIYDGYARHGTDVTDAIMSKVRYSNMMTVEEKFKAETSNENTEWLIHGDDNIEQWLIRRRQDDEECRKAMYFVK